RRRGVRYVRRVRAPLLLALASTALVSAVARPARAADPTPIDAVGPDLADAFTGTNLLFYGAAIVETGVLAYSGGDHEVRVWVQRHVGSTACGDGAYVAGYALPVLVAPAIWLSGLAARDAGRTGLTGAGSAAVQALVITAATTALLKWTTARPYPLHRGDPRAPDVPDHPSYTRDFRPIN